MTTEQNSTQHQHNQRNVLRAKQARLKSVCGTGLMGITSKSHWTSRLLEEELLGDSPPEDWTEEMCVCAPRYLQQTQVIDAKNLCIRNPRPLICSENECTRFVISCIRWDLNPPQFPCLAG